MQKRNVPCCEVDRSFFAALLLVATMMRERERVLERENLESTRNERVFGFDFVSYSRNGNAVGVVRNENGSSGEWRVCCVGERERIVCHP